MEGCLSVGGGAMYLLTLNKRVSISDYILCFNLSFYERMGCANNFLHEVLLQSSLALLTKCKCLKVHLQNPTAFSFLIKW